MYIWWLPISWLIKRAQTSHTHTYGLQSMQSITDCDIWSMFFLPFLFVFMYVHGLTIALVISILFDSLCQLFTMLVDSANTLDHGQYDYRILILKSKFLIFYCLYVNGHFDIKIRQTLHRVFWMFRITHAKNKDTIHGRQENIENEIDMQMDINDHQTTCFGLTALTFSCIKKPAWKRSK